MRLASAKRAGTWRRKVNLGAEMRIGGWLWSQLVWQMDETKSLSLLWMTCNLVNLKSPDPSEGWIKMEKWTLDTCWSVGFATTKAGWSEAVVNYYNLNEHTAAFPSFALFSPSKTTKIIIQVKLSSHHRFKLRSTRINVLCHRQPTHRFMYQNQYLKSCCNNISKLNICWPWCDPSLWWRHILHILSLSPVLCPSVLGCVCKRARG